MDDLDIPRMGVPEKLMHQLSIAEQHEYLMNSLPNRGRLSRRLFLGASASIGALAMLGNGGSQAMAADVTPTPFGRHLAYGKDPQTQMAISWCQQGKVKNPFLRVGTDPSQLGAKVPAEVRHLHTSLTTVTTDQYYAHATLDHLLPDTQYYYVVGHDGHTPQAADAVGFRTAPSKRQPFTFTAYGDQGNGTDAGRNIDTLSRIKPAFHLHAGDICYADSSGGGTIGDKYDPRVWDGFFKLNEKVAQSSPWMVTTGNHDLEAYYSTNGYAGHVARFDFPGTGFDPVGAPSVYSFTHGNVAVVAVDSNDHSYEIIGNQNYTQGRQAAWLEQQFTKFRADKNIDFIVCYHHYCAYSTTSNHASDGKVREVFSALYDKYNIDLVIQGHNHVYERTDSVRANKVTAELPIGATHDPAKGVVYVTAGSGGAGLYKFPAPDTYAGHETPHVEVDSYYWTPLRSKTKETISWSRVRYTGHMILRVDVDPGDGVRKPSMLVRSIAPNDSEIDRFTISR